MRYSRRGFVAGLGAIVAVSTRATAVGTLVSPALLYPPVDLSHFDAPLRRGSAKLQIGYAGIAWDGKDRSVIRKVAALGYRGIQLHANVLKEYPDPHALRDLLMEHRLTLVALLSGSISLDPVFENQTITTHVARARYLRAAGGKYLQIFGAPSGGQHLAAASCKREGHLLTVIGKQVADYGIQTGFCAHMNTTGQTISQVDAILDDADSRYVKLVIDVANLQKGGGDPAMTIRKYGRRLLFLQFKDVESARDTKGHPFVEPTQAPENYTQLSSACSPSGSGAGQS